MQFSLNYKIPLLFEFFPIF